MEGLVESFLLRGIVLNLFKGMIDASSFSTHNPDCDYVPKIHSALNRHKLTDNQLIICSPYALGFSFGNKRWGT